MKTRHFFPIFILFSLLLFPVCRSNKNSGKNTADLSSFTSYPEFSWDHVPLYMHMRKVKAFTAEELKYLAGFPVITLEKTTGMATYGSTENGSIEAAKAIKRLNPDTKILYYRNVMVNYHMYDINDELATISHPFLEDRSGNMNLHSGKREVYDLSNAEVREWWVDHSVKMLQHPELDGLFLDGNIKALEPAFLGKEIGMKKKEEVAEGYDLMMQDMRKRLPPGKLMIANILRARLPDAGLSYLKYFDGSYLEGIESEANGLSHLEYIQKGIAAFQQAAREGKIICMSMGLGDAVNKDLRIDDTRQKVKWGPELHKRLEYSLAFFLVCAEKYSYFLAHDGYDVNDHHSAVWLKRFPEYDKPLGSPKGTAVKDGYTYTREFEHAKVFLDIENEVGKITWEN